MPNELLTTDEASKLMADIIAEHVAQAPEHQQQEFLDAVVEWLSVSLGGFPPTPSKDNGK